MFLYERVALLMQQHPDITTAELSDRLGVTTTAVNLAQRMLAKIAN